MKLLKSLFFIGLTGLFSVSALADGHGKKMDKAATYDCETLLAEDYSLVPVVVGYIVGVYGIAQVDALDPVEIDDIISECQKAPKSKVAAVAKKVAQ